MTPDITTDHFLDHGIAVKQFSKAGHRSGLDAIMLASTVPETLSGPVADLGAGAGVVGMAVAHRCPSSQVDLFEIDPHLSALSRESAALDHNGHLAERVRSYIGDVEQPAEMLAAVDRRPGAYACVVANPPYNDDTHRASPDPRRSAAHMAKRTTAERWVKTAAHLLAHRGHLALILRPENLLEWGQAVQASLGGMVICPLHPRGDKAASRLLIGATKDSRAALRILPALVLHNADGTNTQQAEEILRGRASIDLFS